MKNKKTIIGTILLLFAISGFCNIVSVFADSYNLLPRGYVGYSEYCNHGDTIDYEVTSDRNINIYIMNEEQLELYLAGSELAPEYFLVQILSVSYIHYTYVIDGNDGNYCVLITNPSYTNEANIVVLIRTIPGEPEKNITILSPKSTDTFDNGYNSISWTTTGYIDNVRIELYYKNSFLEVIESSTYNDGSYSWYLSSNDIYSEGQYYQIRISDYSDDSIYVLSDSFTINIDPSDIDDSIITTNLLLFVIIPIAVIGVIIIAYIIFKKKSREEPTIQTKEFPKITYCPECGIKIADTTKDHCSQCGGKIIK